MVVTEVQRFVNVRTVVNMGTATGPAKAEIKSTEPLVAVC